jgi:hypothetical protein
MGEKRGSLWVQPINEKREKENTMQCFLQEMRCDENKFKNFTRLSLETSGFIVNVISGKIRRKDANHRRIHHSRTTIACYPNVSSMFNLKTNDEQQLALAQNKMLLRLASRASKFLSAFFCYIVLKSVFRSVCASPIF